MLLSSFLVAACNGQSNKTSKNMKTINLTQEEFSKKIIDLNGDKKEWNYLGDKPAIIDFYASWCGPCKMVAPILEELAAEYADQIYIYKVDTEKEQDIAAMFGIRSIPSILFIPMKGQPQMMQGALPKATFKEAINDILLKK
ncbi:MAG: thioredoxin [Rikenellaceae bacterium]